MLNLHCPNCHKPFQVDQKDVEQSKTFPFCSEKCKMADLEGWFTERYRFSSPLKEKEESKESNKNEKDEGQ
jgi:endogenous inhibitor of DNA gyrase (YacG/DUF329 family)